MVYRLLVKWGFCILNRNYDVCSCLSQSENTKSKVLSVKTEFVRVYERACHEDWLSILIG